jgi:hypothetical protein
MVNVHVRMVPFVDGVKVLVMTIVPVVVLNQKEEEEEYMMVCDYIHKCILSAAIILVF